MSQHTNIVRIKAVANSLGDLREKVVFVGGATVALYASREVFEVRPTDDVDVIIEILNYKDRVLLEETLRNLGFMHDISSGIVCRYIIDKITVDIMPTDDTSIGFSNKWYPEGFRKAIEYKIDEHLQIRILTPPYFIATKMEAYKGRGEGDGRTSHDFEDIVYVLEQRAQIWDEFKSADDQVQQYLKTEFNALLRNRNIFEWVDCHVERATVPATKRIIDSMKLFVE